MKLFVSKVSEPTINRNSVANQHQHQQDLDHQIAHSPLASLDGSLVDPESASCVTWQLSQKHVISK